MVLDPLSALGLAGNVVQLVDFSWKLLSHTNALYKSSDGASLESREMGMIADDLSRLTNRLHVSLQVTTKSAMLTTDEEGLRDLSEACEGVARELLAALDKLKVKGKHQKWESFRKALVAVWSKEKIADIVRRLSAFRSQLDTHVLLSLRTSIDLVTLQQSEIFDTLDVSMQSIINKLLEHQKSISIEFNDAYINLGKAQAHTDTMITEEHARTRTEILDAIREARDPNCASSAIRNALNASKYDRDVPIETRILESLRFKAMPDRHDEIPTSHKKTFEWVYRDSTQETKSWSNFAEWLRRDDGIFWIAGKAGSGKSTLMKYLSDNTKTRQELLSWSQDTPLIVASFFFWKAGTTMQKSQIGLLQSLLHETLSQCEELIPIVLPARYHEYQFYDQRGEVPFIGEWSRAELSRAFTCLVTQNVLPAKFCFLIDGLDEYDGDPEAIVALFKNIPPSSSIKICVSSRPLVVCEEAFDKGPMLMLQDLTYRDIEMYVSDMLGEHERMLELKREDPEGAPQLVTEIVDRASGVFLWVKLVVRSLLDGLSNYDRVSDLQERLRVLPVDLEDLYWHMLKDVEPFYRAQAWRLFQIVRGARSPLTSLLLSFADEDPQTTLAAEIKILKREEIEARCKAVQRRLKSRCKGLLEIQFSSRTQINSKVLFLHRSVDDFLQKKEVQNMLLGDNKHNFDANEALMRSQLMRLKWHDPLDSLHRAVLADMVPEFFEYAKAAELNTGESIISTIQQFDETAQLSWRAGQLGNSNPPSLESSDDPPISTPETQDSWVEIFWMKETKNQCGESFLTLAIQFGLSLYVKHAISQDLCLLTHRKGLPLLEFAIAPHWKRLPRPLSSSVVRVLLSIGADPNAPYNGATAWQNFLTYAYASLPTSISTPEEQEVVDTWFEICKLFLEYGADPEACYRPGLRFGGKKDGEMLTAADVIAGTFSKVDILRGVELNRLLVRKRSESESSKGMLSWLLSKGKFW